MNLADPRAILGLAEVARSLSGAEKAQATEGLYATAHWLLSQERFADAAEVLRAMCLVAPHDERAWVALGAAHEGAGHLPVAKEIYAVGCTVSKPAGRCELALARALKRLEQDDLACEAVDRAEAIAEEEHDDALRTLVAWERRAS